MRTLLFFLVMTFSVYYTYGQTEKDTKLTFSDFENDNGAFDEKDNMRFLNQSTPFLIPTTDGQANYYHPNINIYGIKDSLDIIVSIDVRFDNDLTDMARDIKPIRISLRTIVFPDGKVLLNACDIDSYDDMYLWSKVSETFINWMYQQPFNNYIYREKKHPLHPELPITALTFTYKVKLIP